ncbi:MAG: hypothetical protein J7M38_04525 [Armatimonadetes bacterium]|nr:hypothetical protein [Armatimonadota bacterium]
MRTALAVLLVALGSVAWAQQEGGNLITNPGFEDGLEGWDERGKPIVRDEEVRFTGRYSCKSVGSADLRYPDFHWVKSVDIPARPNTGYRFSLMMKASFTAGTMSPSIREVGEDGKTTAYHTAVKLSPGDYDWHAVSRDFYSTGRAHHFQVYLIFRDVIGAAWYDDIKLVELTPEPLPPIGTGAAVTFPGSAGSLDMRVATVRQLKIMPPVTVVETTGAVYRVGGDGATITGSQRIGVEREAVTIHIAPPPGQLKVLRSDESVYVLGNEKLEIGVQCDSLIVLAPGVDATFTVTGSYGGAWTQNQQGCVQVIDDDGGVCVYPYIVPGTGVGYEVEQEPGDLTRPGWKCSYELGAGTLLGVSIFLPRPYDWEKSFDWQLAHTSNYPTDSALETWSRYVKLVTLHEGMWAGGSPRTHVGPYEPLDADQFRRVIATCHRLGLKLIPYMSPYYFYDQSIDAFLENLAERREKYGFDGIYYDGIYFKDWVKSYKIMRRTREMFPDGPIYLHTSWGPPVGQHDIWCPFVDTYADIVLRGEGRQSDRPDDGYMRYVAAGYKLSNAIGLMKGHKWAIPYAEQLTIMLSYNGRARLGVYPGRDAKGDFVWPGQDGKLENDWTRVYWPKLQQMRAEWEAGE